MTGAPAVEDDAEPLPPVQRLRLTLGERMPGWVRRRCGVDPRTLAACCAVLAVLLAFAVHHYWSGRPQTVPAAQAVAVGAETAADDAAPTSSPAPSVAPTTAPAPTDPVDDAGARPLVVDVAGEVAEPGVVTLPPGARVSDAIEAAGGADPGSDTDHLNRARLLADGEHVVVGGDPAPAAQQPPPAAPPGEHADGGVLNINAADARELEQLPGVGPVLSASIVAHREQHGPFTTVDELLAVSGIGETRLADLRDRVVL